MNFILCGANYQKNTLKKYLSKECSFEEQRIERIKELYLKRNINLSSEKALKVFDYYLCNYELN